jgi:hypothetical protein
MKVKISLVLLITFFLMFGFILTPVLGGDESNPEVDDTTGETNEPGREFRDIESAWFGPETDDLITISLKLAGSPPGLMDLAQAQDTTTFEYEVYFDINGKGYAVVAIIQYAANIGASTPVVGVYANSGTWDWELRSVNYALGSDIVTSETSIDGINSTDYYSSSVVIEWEIEKSAIGIESGFDGRGQMIVDTWAGVWNADENPSGEQRSPESQAWDYAHTHHSDPGEPYRITGVGGVDYNVILSADELVKEAYGGSPAIFYITAENNGSGEVLVDFNPVPSDDSWSVVLDPNSTTISKGTSITLRVEITPPRDVANGTIFMVVIGGTINAIDGNDTVPILTPVTLTAIGLTPLDEDDEGGFLDMLMENLAIIVGAIAIVIVAIIVLAILIRK